MLFAPIFFVFFRKRFHFGVYILIFNAIMKMKKDKGGFGHET